MAPGDSALGRPLRPGGPRVVVVELVEQDGAGDPGVVGSQTGRQRHGRQEQISKVPGLVLPDREDRDLPLTGRLEGEHEKQHVADPEGRGGDEHRRADESAAVRLATRVPGRPNAERDPDRGSREDPGDGELERRRHPLEDDVEHRTMELVRLAEVALYRSGEVAGHLVQQRPVHP